MPVTNQALPGGYQLLNYRIDRQISRGGFSIVYRAFDETGSPVAIKEYLPSSLVLRTEGDIVRASSAENLTSFRYGMKCFFEEGRALAKINHPNVVRVLNFFRANETVYMVMRYERGRTLQQQIQMRQDQMSRCSSLCVCTSRKPFSRCMNTCRTKRSDIWSCRIWICCCSVRPRS